MDTRKLVNLSGLSVHLLTATPESFIPAGFKTQEIRLLSLPLTLFHIIPLLSASCSSQNVWGCSGPLSFMNNGFRLDKWPAIHHQGAPMATTEVFLCPSASRQRDGLAWDLPPHVLGGVLGRNAGILGAGRRGRDISLLQEAILICGPCLWSLLPGGWSPLASVLHLHPEPVCHHAIHLPTELQDLIRWFY